MADCIFCDVFSGKQPASFVYRDEESAAFLDLFPVARGHLLVVPRIHAAGLAELEPRLGGYLFQIGQRLAAAVREATGCPGVNLFLADGKVAGQTVFHVHLHVIPRHPADDLGFRLPPGGPRQAVREELDGVAAAIAKKL